MWLSQFLVVSAAMAIACAMPVLQRQTSNSRLLFESTRGIFFENVFTRSNGHLLLTTFDQGRIYSLDPSSPNPEPQLVAQIPGSNSSFGISEISPEVFAISSGNYIISDFRFIRGSAKITTLDLTRGFREGRKPVMRTVAQVANTTMLNGMVSLPFSPHVVLSADSNAGQVFRINTLTGSVKVIFQQPLLAGTSELPMGINGMKILDDHLYFTSSAHGFYGRFRINAQGSIVGELEQLSLLPAGWGLRYDDFTLNSEGVAYVATQTSKLVQITADGNQTILLDDSTDLVPRFPTAAALSKDEQTVYLVTGGSSTDPSKGGQIIEVKV